MDHQGRGITESPGWPADPAWPDKAAGDMTDGEVLAYARQVYGRFRTVPRWDPENDDLLRRWAVVCGEMARRGMTDIVTEGGRGGDVIALARDTREKP